MHSTTITMLTEHCAQAMRWSMDGRPWISEARLDLGVTAHAVLEACRGTGKEHWKAIADPIVRRLAVNGYTFDGQQQPPLNLEEAQEGSALALRWMGTHGSEPIHSHTEIGLAIDANGNPCPYEKGAYQAIIDVVRVDKEEEEESCYTALTVRDYKSAWPTGAGSLESFQRKGQAVVSAARFADWDIMRLEVCNLRTQQIFTKEIWNDDEGRALLSEWQDEVLQGAQIAREAAKSPVARPGAGCVGCPYIVACPDAEKALQADDAAQAWAIAKAKSDALRPIIAKIASEAPIKIEGGSVGYRAKAKNVPANDVARQVYDYWRSPNTEDGIVGMIAALRLGVTQIRSIGKAIGRVEGDAVRDDFLDEALATIVASELKTTKRPT